jgi:hypothetical protein
MIREVSLLSCLFVLAMVQASFALSEGDEFRDLSELQIRPFDNSTTFDLRDNDGRYWRAWAESLHGSNSSVIKLAKLLNKSGVIQWKAETICVKEAKVQSKVLLAQDSRGVYHLVFSQIDDHLLPGFRDVHLFFHMSSANGVNWTDPVMIFEPSFKDWAVEDSSIITLPSGGGAPKERMELYLLVPDLEGKLWLFWRKWRYCEWRNCVDVYTSTSDRSRAVWLEPDEAGRRFGTSIHNIRAFIVEENGVLSCIYETYRCYKVYGTSHRYITSMDGGETWQEPGYLVPHFWEPDSYELCQFLYLKDKDGDLWYFWQAWKKTPREDLLKKRILDLNQDNGNTWRTIGYIDGGVLFEDIYGVGIRWTDDEAQWYVRVKGEGPNHLPIPDPDLESLILITTVSLFMLRGCCKTRTTPHEVCPC